MSDVVFLGVNVTAFTVRVITLSPAPVLFLDVLHEMGHGRHELERIVGGIVTGGRADESAEKLHCATRVPWVDIRVAGLRRRCQQEPAVFLGGHGALQDDFNKPHPQVGRRFSWANWSVYERWSRDFRVRST